MPSSGNSLLCRVSESHGCHQLDIDNHSRKGHFESLLYGLEHLLILIAADKGDAQPFGSKSSRTTDPVKVRVGIRRKIVIDGKVDAFNIDPTTKDVSGNADALVELFEFFISFDTVEVISKDGIEKYIPFFILLPLFLTDTRMHGNAGKVAFTEKLIEFSGPQSTLDEYDDLIELKSVEQLIQLSVLLRFTQFDIILL